MVFFMDTGSEFFRANFTYICEVYLRFLQNPSSVDASWGEFFKNLSEDEKSLIADFSGAKWDKNHSKVIGMRNEFSSLPISEVSEILSKEKEIEKKKKDAINIAMKEGLTGGQNEVLDFANEMRNFGHLSCNLDPLDMMKKVAISQPSIKDLERETEVFGVKRKAKDHIAFFTDTYANTLGIEAMHIKDKKEREFIYAQAEKDLQTSNEVRKYMLETLIKAETFEHTIHLKFPGAKRFSVEGGEGAIALLEQILLQGSENGVKDVVIGMAHRGRLNVLTHTLGKPYHAMFSEFMGVSSIPEGVPGSGDVKYHLGLSTKRMLINQKEITLSLTPNPSHLESVNPVVMGRVRAKQDVYGAKQGEILPILLHGDTAMSGQGIVYECLQMANLRGYSVHGTIHIIINNQVGFTAVLPEAKSGTYSSDVAKTIDAPILHVNGNDIESVIKAGIIAANYRQTFGKDVIIELICYRKYGHNEGDEPMFTQPIMYEKIKQMPTPATVCGAKLLARNVISANFENDFREKQKQILNEEFEKAKSYKPTKADWLEGRWSHVKRLENVDDLFNVKTSITERIFDMVGGTISIPPENFDMHSNIKKLLESRKMSLLAGDKIDWATAELLAYGSLMLEGHKIRLSGEDAERGTFSHRHSVYINQKTGEKFYPLNNIKADGVGHFEVMNSLLSEYGVLGFEYGYSISAPDALTIWEAQYGDFANGAVTIFDQYISSGEDKWLRMSGLVCLLPHGFEGQGPEHSSARLERYLQYAAENNIIVGNFTTPANLFHALRRQLKMPFRKPLIIMTPKSGLRNKLNISTMKDFTEGAFKPIIADDVENYKTAKKIVFVSGKLFYELYEERKKLEKEKDVAIIRIEQYYPFPSKIIASEIAKFKSVKQFAFSQEEPKNMGAWNFIRDYLEDATNSKVAYIGRNSKPSPATGFASVHNKEQTLIIQQSLEV